MSKTLRTIFMIILFGSVCLCNSCNDVVTTKNPNKENLEIGIIARQSYWTVWYSGKDGKFGERNYHLIDDENIIGLVKEDIRSHDDIVVVDDFHIPLGQSILFKMTSLDVLHSAYFVDFKAYRDIVPGMETRCIINTKEIENFNISESGNSSFESKLVCNEICGAGHYGMRKTIRVVSNEEYSNWVNSQLTISEVLKWD